MSKGCKHLATTVTRAASAVKRMKFYAHLRRADVSTLVGFLTEPHINTYYIIGDGFDVVLERGQNGSLLVTVTER